MAITDPEWNQATDPYLMAHVLETGTIVETGLGTSDWAKVRLEDPKGILQLITDNPAIQEVYVEKVDDPGEKQYCTACIIAGGTGTRYHFELTPGQGFEHARALPDRAVPSPLNPNVLNESVIDLVGAADPTQDTDATHKMECDIYFPWKGTGSALPVVRLYILTAYAWNQKDPAQIAMSWLMHHLATSGGGTVADYRARLHKEGFQAASAFYDLWPMNLDAVRTDGKTIGTEIKEMLAATRLRAAMREDGKFTLVHAETVEQTDTIFDVDDPLSGISNFVGGWTSQYSLGRLKLIHGNYIRANQLATSSPDNDERSVAHEYPILPEEPPFGPVAYAESLPKAEQVVVDLPSLMRRDQWLLDFDIAEVREPVLEAQYRQDIRHMIYAMGMAPKLRSSSLGMDETDVMEVSRKRINLKDLSATVTVVEQTPLEGVRINRIPLPWCGIWRAAYNARYSDLEIATHIDSDAQPGRLTIGSNTPFYHENQLCPNWAQPDIWSNIGGPGTYRMLGSQWREDYINGWPALDNTWIDTVANPGVPQVDHGYTLASHYPGVAVLPTTLNQNVDGWTWTALLYMPSVPPEGANTRAQLLFSANGPGGVGGANVWLDDGSSGNIGLSWRSGPIRSFNVAVPRDAWYMVTIRAELGSVNKATLYLNDFAVGAIIDLTLDGGFPTSLYEYIGLLNHHKRSPVVSYPAQIQWLEIGWAGGEIDLQDITELASYYNSAYRLNLITTLSELPPAVQAEVNFKTPAARTRADIRSDRRAAIGL